MNAKELFEQIKHLFDEGRVVYEELRYEHYPEWDRDIITIKSFFKEYYNMGGCNVMDLTIDFDKDGKMVEFQLG